MDSSYHGDYPVELGAEPEADEGPAAAPSPRYFKLVPLVPFFYIVSAGIAGYFVQPPWRGLAVVSLIAAWILFTVFLGITGRRDREARKYPGTAPRVARWLSR